MIKPKPQHCYAGFDLLFLIIKFLDGNLVSHNFDLGSSIKIRLVTHTFVNFCQMYLISISQY